MSEDIRNRAWFTAHVRMRSEARLRWQSRFLNFLIFWFSTVLTCLTVYQLTAAKNPVRDITSAALAIVVLALSIFIPSLDLDKQAAQFRECYLKLQRLMDTVQDDAEFTSSYYDILDAYTLDQKKDVVCTLSKRTPEEADAMDVEALEYEFSRLIGKEISELERDLADAFS